MKKFVHLISKKNGFVELMTSCKGLMMSKNLCSCQKIRKAVNNYRRLSEELIDISLPKEEFQLLA